jgi:hypothetical protein
MYKKVSYPKQRSPLAMHIFVLPGPLPESLLRRVTPYLISDRGAYSDSYPRLCTIPYPSRYPEPYLGCYLSPTQSFSRVLPRHIPDQVNPTLPERLPSRVKSYPIVSLTIPEAYPAK